MSCTGALPDEIAQLPDWDRLARISLFGTAQPVGVDALITRVACFSESTLQAIRTLVCDGRYSACGIGFSKDVVFAAGGGPCFYERGDLWPHVALAPVESQHFFTLYWPGGGARSRRRSTGAPSLERIAVAARAGMARRRRW